MVDSAQIRALLGILFLSVGLILPPAAWGQTGQVQGTVVDATTQKPLPGVNVTLADTARGTATNAKGEFVIDGLAPGTYTIRATFVGYQPATKADVRVRSSRPTIIRFELQTSSVELDSVVVTGSAFADKKASPTSVRTLGPEEVKRVPGSQNDVSRTLRSLPGVIGGVDSRSDLIVRGGAPSENAYFLDGIRIPRINHFSTQGTSGGALGLINVDFIRETTFYTGGFSAKYGNALSSVLKIDNRSGSPNQVAGDFTLGAVEAALTLDGPLPSASKSTDTGNWIFSIRRSYLQFLFKALGLPIRPEYWDAQTKVEFNLGPNDQLSFVGIGAIDTFNIVPPDNGNFESQEIVRRTLDNDQWSYSTGVVWQHLMEDGVLKTSLSRTETDFSFSDETTDGTTLIRNESREVINRLRTDLEMRLTNSFTLAAGAGGNRPSIETSFLERSRPGTTFNRTIEFKNDLRRWTGFAYLQGTKRWWNDRLTTTLGLRADGSTFIDTPLYLGPRFSAKLQVAPNWSINAATGIFRQSPSSISLAVQNRKDQYVNDNLPYIRTDHYIAGVEWQPESSVQLTLEGYYKDYKDYPVLANDGRVSLANLGGSFGFVGAQPLRGVGTGRAYGVELFGRKKLTDRFYGLAAYTLGWSEFAGANGTLRPSDWDIRHAVSLTAGYRIADRWKLGVRWRFRSGRPFTPFDPEASAKEYEISGRGVPDRSRLNELRTPPYHRLDVRIDRRFSFTNWNAVVYLDLQNVYDRANLFGYRYTKDPSVDGNRRAIDGTSFLPTFGFSVEW